jgi:YegS/Rv2252/BmrU family lipid kinase
MTPAAPASGNAGAASSGDVVGTTLFLVNPASASGRTARRWPALRDRLAAAGVDLRVALTERPCHATDLVRDFIAAGGREVVVLGGDGTIGEAVAGCITADGSAAVVEGVTLSLVHQGTGGDLVRGLGVPREAEAAIDLAASATAVRRPIDVWAATYRQRDGSDVTRAFASTSNVGMGSEVVERVTGPLKRLGKNGAFAVATVTSLVRNRPRKVHITLDGQLLETAVVDVTMANNQWMGGGMHVAPAADPADGRLDVVVISAAGMVKLVRTFPRIYKGTHVEDPLVRVVRAREVAVDVPPGAPAQGVVLDGEPVGTTPVRYRCIDRAINVRVPA